MLYNIKLLIKKLFDRFILQKIWFKGEQCNKTTKGKLKWYCIKEKGHKGKHITAYGKIF
jgi:hypothetical protein